MHQRAAGLQSDVNKTHTPTSTIIIAIDPLRALAKWACWVQGDSAAGC
jgi:hypothetical protein